jgi:hypothetical protein
MCMLLYLYSRARIYSLPNVLWLLYVWYVYCVVLALSTLLVTLSADRLYEARMCGYNLVSTWMPVVIYQTALLPAELFLKWKIQFILQLHLTSDCSWSWQHVAHWEGRNWTWSCCKGLFDLDCGKHHQANSYLYGDSNTAWPSAVLFTQPAYFSPFLRSSCVPGNTDIITTQTMRCRPSYTVYNAECQPRTE